MDGQKAWGKERLTARGISLVFACPPANLSQDTKSRVARLTGAAVPRERRENVLLSSVLGQFALEASHAVSKASRVRFLSRSSRIDDHQRNDGPVADEKFLPQQFEEDGGHHSQRQSFTLHYPRHKKKGEKKKHDAATPQQMRCFGGVDGLLLSVLQRDPSSSRRP